MNTQAPTLIEIKFEKPTLHAEQLIEIFQQVATLTQPKRHEGRGSKSPKWGKGPSLLQQRDFLNGINRDEYNRQFVQR